ncbi:amino acid ABC transporter substrate-binding protein (PAAT family) [Christiangramia gaetbulicola]|uniref:Amino acid ABC transporter substrate-binding protein (PAAT family) n=1 Tax=Christiangramia gaetbulicola TaxID=703340 RepID=A0A2T6AH49_9FLAO|nr:transporter substrate-binding domain-containing protein [Christiangramia gaetbulicola]PTX43144.1 amino acid ABC transporter substrate-binding protein (PAAT family) [Christiangramia gaetbulicola]
MPIYRQTLIYLLTFFCSFQFFSQEPDSLQSNKKLIIGVTETPPFVEKRPNGYSGLSITSWKMVNEQLQASYEFKEYDNLESLLNGIENGEVDLSINPITVTDNRMRRMEFSQPYFISHTSVVKRKESKFLKHLKNFFSWDFFSIIGLLLFVILIFGILVWAFERNKNKEEFGGNFRGIMQGFWWSAVTMTTVGYGDKSPKTTGGRVIGVIWMFMAVIIISSFTAGIASSLTVKSINEEITNIQDLERFDVTTVKSSSSQELLDLYNIENNLVSNGLEGLEAVRSEKTTLFVYDEPILKFEIERLDLSDDLEILGQSLKKDYYSYAFPKDSRLLKKVDPILVRTLKSMEWANLIRDYN